MIIGDLVTQDVSGINRKFFEALSANKVFSSRQRSDGEFLITLRLKDPSETKRSNWKMEVYSGQRRDQRFADPRWRGIADWSKTLDVFGLQRPLFWLSEAELIVSHSADFFCWLFLPVASGPPFFASAFKTFADDPVSTLKSVSP